MKKRLRLVHYVWGRRARFQNRRALLRALWWLGIRAYRFEICFSCGRPVGLVWAADDQIWLDVFENRGGICCIGCFDRRFAQETGVVLIWKPMPDPEFADQVRAARVYKVRDHLTTRENERLTNLQIDRFLENKYVAMSAAEAAELLGMTLRALDESKQKIDEILRDGEPEEQVDPKIAEALLKAGQEQPPVKKLEGGLIDDRCDCKNQPEYCDWCQARFEQNKGGTESGADQEGDPAKVPEGRAADPGLDPGEGADSAL